LVVAGGKSLFLPEVLHLMVLVVFRGGLAL
jgi:hypothetical protein